MTPANLPPDDAALERLLGDALRRDVDRPVDADGLLVGARRGAARRRRHRTTGLAVAAVVVLAGIPVGLQRIGGVTGVDTASSAGSAQSAAAARSPAAAAQPQLDGGADASGGAPSPGQAPTPSGAVPAASAPALAASSSPVPAASAAVGAERPRQTVPLQVPDGALLVPADLPQVLLSTTADTANRRQVAPTPGSATCGQTLPAPVEGGSRSATYQAGSSSWLLTSTVRVYPVPGAQTYLGEAQRLSCAVAVPGPLGQDAVMSRGQVDSAGRTHYYGVVRVGPVISEITLVVPARGAAAGPEVARLLAVAAARLTGSGLVATAEADPALGG